MGNESNIFYLIIDIKEYVRKLRLVKYFYIDDDGENIIDIDFVRKINFILIFKKGGKCFFRYSLYIFESILIEYKFFKIKDNMIYYK